MEGKAGCIIKDGMRLQVKGRIAAGIVFFTTKGTKEKYC